MNFLDKKKIVCILGLAALFGFLINVSGVSKFQVVYRAVIKDEWTNIIQSGISNWNPYNNPDISNFTSNIPSPEMTTASTIVEERKTQLTAVLFTTFKNKPEKHFIYSNTIHNWASFLPHVQPVLFATFTNSPILDVANKSGWHVLPCPRVNEAGTPFLKDMYQEVWKRYGDARLAAFSNGDILYDNGLLDTLNATVRNFPRLNTTLVVGRRWNHKVNPNYKVYDNDPLWKPAKVKAIAKAGVSSLFRTDAEDYFFVTKDFKWSQIKDVVIGRAGYDNYLVAMAIRLKASAIDATLSISAVHQTGTDGNYAGHSKENKDKSYNHKLIGRFAYGGGVTTACWFRTQYKNGLVEITQIRFPPTPKPKA